jgi:hypothetical protein
MDIPAGYQSIGLGFKHIYIACNASDEGTVRYEWYGCVDFQIYILRQLGWMKVEAWKLQVGFLLKGSAAYYNILQSNWSLKACSVS